MAAAAGGGAADLAPKEHSRFKNVVGQATDIGRPISVRGQHIWGRVRENVDRVVHGMSAEAGNGVPDDEKLEEVFGKTDSIASKFLRFMPFKPNLKLNYLEKLYSEDDHIDYM